MFSMRPYSLFWLVCINYLSYGIEVNLAHIYSNTCYTLCYFWMYIRFAFYSASAVLRDCCWSYWLYLYLERFVCYCNKRILLFIII